ncbi:MAG: arylsulfatase [Planctomycetota bacterium]
MQFAFGSFRWVALFVAAVVAVPLLAGAALAGAPRPNIVLIVADDMGFSDLGCYGGEIRTPHLNRLAAEGLRYTQFYNAAKCHTTRASLMSGLYPHHTGCEVPLAARAARNTGQRIEHSGVSIASVLQNAGYAAFASGKWHAGGRPMQRGFQHSFGLPGGACSYFTPAKALLRDEERVQIEPSRDFYFTDAITEEAVGYLNEHFASDPKRPFFLYVAYTAPHWPLQAPEEDIARYRGAYAAGWQATRQKRYERLIEMGVISPQWQLPKMDPPKDWQSVEHQAWEQRRMEVYAAMVDRMDQGIGRVVDAIRERGALENTVVFFLSDNGGSQEEVQADTGFMLGVMPQRARDGSPVQGGNDPAVMPGPETTFQTVGHEWGNANNTPFRYGKVRVHEGGIASPLIVHWPAGIRDRGGLRRQMAHVIDFLPTCMELAGAAYPREYNGRSTEELHGVSLVPTFEDRALDRNALFFEMSGNRSVRTEKWKAVAREGLKKELRDAVHIPLEYWELYDMQSDRTETKNVAAEHPEVVAELVARWEQWIARP